MIKTTLTIHRLRRPSEIHTITSLAQLFEVSHQIGETDLAQLEIEGTNPDGSTSTFTYELEDL